MHLDVYDDRLAITSPGGMYSGQIVQDLSIEEIASDRRNPILADVMAQLDYNYSLHFGNLNPWSNTTKFKAKYVNPLLEAQLVGMTLPEKPTSPKQRYFLTANGRALLANVTSSSHSSDLVEIVRHVIGSLSEEEKRIALELLNKEH